MVAHLARGGTGIADRVFPNDRAVIRLVGAQMLEQNDEWAVSRCYMRPESLAAFGDDPVLRVRALAA